MPRINDESAINPQAAPAAGQGGQDWTDKLNAIIGNARGAIGEVKSLIEIQRGQGPAAAQGSGGSGGSGPGAGLQSFLSIIRAAGYGDKPIGQIIAEFAPYSVNQLEGEVKKRVIGKLLTGQGGK